MVRFEFTLEDLARTRFAISPMWELVSGLRLMRHPETAAPHLPWVREALPVAAELGSEVLMALTHRHDYLPDFILPPPTSPVAVFEDELEQIRAMPKEHVAIDIARLFGDRPVPAEVRALLDDDNVAMNELCDHLRTLWERTLENHWPRVRAMLEADLRYRSHRLMTGGPAALFEDLHPNVTFRDSAITIKGATCTLTTGLDGRGLLLVPSAFHWSKVSAIGDEPWLPTLLYPARGLSLLWEAGEPVPDALAAVLGRRRATLLAMLDAPASTTELAARLGASAGGVSMHLTALRDAGLVSAERAGRAVLYARTPAADALIPAATPALTRVF